MKPILFNTEMVRAILDGRKTQTRRVVKPQPANQIQYAKSTRTWGNCSEMHTWTPPAYAGEMLYVREAFAQPFLPQSSELHYRADYNDDDVVLREGPYPDSVPVSDIKWRPSIHMPKEAARLLLRVTDVRVERLQEITDHGARQEGCGEPDVIYYSGALECEFADLWRKTVKPEDWPEYGWGANPWVWVISFERCEKPEG